jgi:diacylglycerol kinase (ATP)
MTVERSGPTERRIRVLWNPSSGRKGGIPTNRASYEAILELMARHGLGDELLETDSEDEATEAARDAVGQGYDVVVAAGGDGSIGLVGRQLLGTRTALGILPLGSVMNIPRMIGLPRDLEEAAEVLGAGHLRHIDVGRVGDLVFFEAGSVGMLAAVSLEATKADEGHYGAILRTVLAAVRYRPSRMTLELDEGRTIETRALLVAVANGPFMGVGFTVAPEASLDDGQFDVRIFLHYSKRELILHFASIAFGRRAYEPRVRTERAARVLITGRRPLPARADSEDIGTTPAAFEILPQALWVVAPGPSAAAG